MASAAVFDTLGIRSRHDLISRTGAPMAMVEAVLAPVSAARK